MDLLAKAGLLTELADQAAGDVHARRRLDRFLSEEGQRAEDSRTATEAPGCVQKVIRIQPS